MPLETRPARPEDESRTDELAAYRVTSRQEIDSLLAELRERALPIVLTGPDGAVFTTTLWSLDMQRGHASFGAEGQDIRLQRLVDAGEIVAMSYLDRVKLQFELHRPILVRSAQACVLQATLPQVVYRFQRRGSFRVHTGDRRAPTLRLRHPSIPEMALALRILDVSVGGCALLLPNDVPPMQPGTQLQRVEVELDLETRFLADVVLHHVSSGSDGAGQRLGCEWRQLDAAAQRALQRFIDTTQRRHRTLWHA